MSESKHTRLEQLLDLLTAEVAERLRTESPRHDDPPKRDRSAGDGPLRPQPSRTPPRPSEPGRQEEIEAEAGPAVPSLADVEAREAVLPPGLPAPPPFAPHTARLLGRMALGLLALVIVINIPISRHGTTLATAMPDRRALVIRDGLVVKEEDDPEIYVYQKGRFRWISSLKAFEMLGYTWQDVHVVDGGFLEPYEIGPPIHAVLKCSRSPHVFRLEGEEKRWIVDIGAFEAEGHVWEDVRLIPCSYLRSLPDGETIPPGHGPPPQP